MATVSIPLLLSEITGEVREVTADGGTIGELLDSLDVRFPGLRAKIERNGKTISTITFTVDGKIATNGLQAPVPENARVAILPTFGGG